MKIAMIGHKRIPSREGGVEIVVEELSKRLVKDGHSVDVYNRKNGKIMDKEYEGIRLIPTFTINKKSLDALIYSFVASIKILFKRYDIIHYHALGPSVMLIIPKIFKKKTKIVVTVHGLDWKRAKWGNFASWYLKLGEKITAKYADEIIVLSQNIKEYFFNTYNRETIFIPNGISEAPIKEISILKEKYGLLKNGYLLFLSRIVPEKGLDYLIKAYEQLNTDKKLVIAGGSSHTTEYYESIVQKVKDNSNIIMTGHVEGETLQELYSNAALYVLPSDIEGMPITLLEALSYQCPVLVSDIAENVQVAGINNSFKQGDVNDLKEKLEERLSSNDKRIVTFNKEFYNWDNITRQMITEVYQRNIK